MIYWILSDMSKKHGRRHDGDFEPLTRHDPASDDVTRYARYRDAVAAAKKLRAKGCHCKPLKQEGVVLYWRLPAAVARGSDLAEVIEFRSRRQADAWQRRAIAEGCEVIECLGLAKASRKARPAKREAKR